MKLNTEYICSQTYKAEKKYIAITTNWTKNCDWIGRFVINCGKPTLLDKNLKKNFFDVSAKRKADITDSTMRRGAGTRTEHVNLWAACKISKVLPLVIACFLILLMKRWKRTIN